MRKIINVVKNNEIFIFTIAFLLMVGIILKIVFSHKVLAFQLLSLSSIIYYIFKFIYYRMFGVLND